MMISHSSTASATVSSSSSPSSSSSSSSSKVRSSKEICQERLCCPQDRTQASFRCDQCGTFQCRHCEKKIHRDSKFLCHERRLLVPPPAAKLCGNPTCRAQNYADVHCDDCKLNLCNLCNETLHKNINNLPCFSSSSSSNINNNIPGSISNRRSGSGGGTPHNQQHKRIRFREYERRLLQQQQQQIQLQALSSLDLGDLDLKDLNPNNPKQDGDPTRDPTQNYISSQPATLLLKPQTISGPSNRCSSSSSSHIKRQPSSSSSSSHRVIIKPLSPLGDNDDSLTYVSLPQEASLLFEAANDVGVDLDLGLDPMMINPEMSFSSAHSDSSIHSIPDVCLTELGGGGADPNKPPQHGGPGGGPLNSGGDNHKKKPDHQEITCFKLVDEDENLLVDNDVDLLKKLGCRGSGQSMVKVVSIFGNTGDGKSHTLNHTFFNGKEVFPTSTSQDSCTIGIWAAYDPNNRAIIIDTEGMLGVTKNQNQRTRLLLKVLAVSDIVIYRTRAERLHNDLFYFLGDASNAYVKHFSEELKAANKRCNLNLSLSTMGPIVIIFHETMHTKVLHAGVDPVEISLRDRFKKLECSFEGFSDLKYVGVQTQLPPTDFRGLRKVVQEQLNNRSIRAPRKPEIIFKVLKVLNGKFSGEIEKPDAITFPDQYFTCTAKCLSCNARCIRSMNHDIDHVLHEPEKGRNCQFQHQYENKVYLCKQCYFKSGKNIIVVPKTSASSDSTWLGFAKYVWSGYVLECPNCGIIYRSHEYWYGNQDIEQVVQVTVSHVWPGDQHNLQGSHNAARKLLDSLHYVADTVTSVGAKPTKVLADWMTDQIAPSYWIPNALIAHCTNCERLFEGNEQKHHCRGCGQGFCDTCSSNKDPVPERGWGDTLVRTCDKCHGARTKATVSPVTPTSTTQSTPVTARKVGEVLGSTIGAMASIVDYPLGIIKDSVRPAYWIPDESVTHCAVCRVAFGPKFSKHHCRDCGKVVCDKCSTGKKTVPLRGWDYPVRACDSCINTSHLGTL